MVTAVKLVKLVVFLDNGCIVGFGGRGWFGGGKRVGWGKSLGVTSVGVDVALFFSMGVVSLVGVELVLVFSLSMAVDVVCVFCWSWVEGAEGLRRLFIAEGPGRPAEALLWGLGFLCSISSLLCTFTGVVDLVGSGVIGPAECYWPVAPIAKLNFFVGCLLW